MTQTDHKPQIEKEYLQYKQSIKDCYPGLLKNSSKKKKAEQKIHQLFHKRGNANGEKICKRCPVSFIIKSKKKMKPKSDAFLCLLAFANFKISDNVKCLHNEDV